jgi:mono/diheme cytochrome c family protein
MREWLKKNPRLSTRAVLIAGLLGAGVAVASPWDIDMVDSVTLKAYEWKMMTPFAEGTVQRPQGDVQRAGANGTYQNDYIPEHDRATDADSVTDPYPADDKTVEKGKALFAVSCAPCHGQEGKGHGPVTTNDPDKGIRRFPVPAPLLSGAGAVTAVRSDGYIYLTIRNGGALMPRYGVSLTDRERWSIVNYIRTLDGAQYKAPETPAAPAAPATGNGGTQK